MIWKLFGIELGFAGRDVGLREPQDLRILRLRFPAPALERGPRRNTFGNARVEKRVELVLVAQQVDAAALLLQVFLVLQKLQVVREERSAAVVLHVHQRVFDEQLTRGLGVDVFERDAAPRRQYESEQRHALVDRRA